MSFWENATTEQRLAQIDGGIECGMNAVQVAMNCGTTPSVINGYARYRERKFGNHGEKSKGAKGKRRCSEMTSCQNLKRAAEKYGGYSDTAFSIFGNEPQEEILSWAEAAQ